MNVRRVTPWKHWPSGDSRPIARIALEPVELSKRYGLKYDKGVDDLDRYQLAAVELASGEQAWLSKYDHDGHAGTVVYVDAGSDVEDAQALLMDAFGIDRDAFVWLAPVPSPRRP
jgi:hypothetical protein